MTPLPRGISPFEKSVAKGLDVQAKFRQLAASALDRAVRDGLQLLELDFPPLVGGELSKTQFDDFDNLSELDANRDWCAQFAPMISPSAGGGTGGRRETWLVFPDDKECELAAKEWSGRRFRDAAKFTSIRAACEAAIGREDVDTKTAKAWGSTFASAFDKLAGGDGVLADSSYLDRLVDDDATAAGGQRRPRLNLVCQPGNGGPVEDWQNVEQLHLADPTAVTCVVNGALDKVRDGYYPALFFPGLAKATPFYRGFEQAFFLKPVSDKGVYGWLYRVYPEPWQVVLQSPKTVTRGEQEVVTVEERVALVSETRPTFTQAVQALLKEAVK